MTATAPTPTSGVEWRAVPKYEGHYDVSENGDVRSVKRRPARLLTPSTTPKGYRVVTLSRDGVERTFKVHNLVLGAFVGPRPAHLPDTRHIDGDPGNNARTNLAYGTRAENATDSIEHGTHARANATYCVNGHEYTPENTLWIDGRRRCRTCRTTSQRADRVRRTARERAARGAITHA